MEGAHGRGCRLRQCTYWNNVVDQDHRVSKETRLARDTNRFRGSRTLQGIQTDSEGASQMDERDEQT
jgi:hypothetical protein